MLDERLAQKVLQAAKGNGADFAELFVENSHMANIYMTDKQIKSNVTGRDSGVGIRIFYGNVSVFAYTNDMSEKSLMETAYTVSRVYSKPTRDLTINLMKQNIENKHPLLIPANKILMQEKVDILKQADIYARKAHASITQVSASIKEQIQKVQIFNSEGLWKEDERNYIRFSLNVIASNGTELQTGGENPGRLMGFEFIRSLDIEALAQEAADSAVLMLTSEYAPSGKFPVVIDNGFGGVIFHEACGHSLETTSISKNASVFCGKLNQPIAHEAVTAIDDGTDLNQWGSTNIDDEGMETQKTVLIENGILKSYIVDHMGSIKMNLPRTGSGRRQSYQYAPASRMRNTYIAPGSYKLDDLIRSVDYGIYAKKMGGGSVNPGTGQFNFSVREGYLIEKGKITKPVRGATLIGSGQEILFKISMVADNLAYAEGMCGSVSGNVPVCVGQPAVKVDDIVVGGRDTEAKC